MCKYCDENSYECEIFYDERNDNYYLDIETSEWNEYDDGFVHQEIEINFCPYCGKKLGEEDVRPIILDWSKGDIEYECPMCGIQVVSNIGTKSNCCGECGCKFDWSEIDVSTKSKSQ